MKNTTILIADDHDIIIDGIKSMISSSPNVEIIGEARNGKEAIEKANTLNPDVILMDISMPEVTGIEATIIITKKFPQIKIIALTHHENDIYILQMFKAGASGYLLKNSRKAELLEAIKCVIDGKKYFSNKIADLIASEIYENTEEKVLLTSREREIIKLVANDLNNYQIAEGLGISLRTAETHRRNIMRKLKVNTVVALIRYAVKNDLVEIS